MRYEHIDVDLEHCNVAGDIVRVSGSTVDCCLCEVSSPSEVVAFALFDCADLEVGM